MKTENVKTENAKAENVKTEVKKVEVTGLVKEPAEPQIEHAKADTKVKATAPGYYDEKVRIEGEVFILRKGDAFGAWMEKADAKELTGQPVEGRGYAKPLYETVQQFPSTLDVQGGNANDGADSNAATDDGEDGKALTKMSKAELVDHAMHLKPRLELSPDNQTKAEMIEAIEGHQSGKPGEVM